MNKLILPIILVTLSIIIRLFPHMPNFTPIGAMAFFGGAYLNKKYSLAIVLFTMLISDYFLLYINPFNPDWIRFTKIYSPAALFHSTTLYVYGSFLIYYLIGRLIANKKSFAIVGLGALAGSIQFFLITNAAVWIDGAYARDLSGLWQSYVMGIPFFRGTVLGDIFYTAAFFGVVALVRMLITKKSIVLQK